MTIFNSVVNFLDEDIINPLEKAGRWIESSKPIQYVENIASIPYNVSRATANTIEAIADDAPKFIHSTEQNIEKGESNIADAMKYLPYLATGLIIFMILK